MSKKYHRDVTAWNLDDQEDDTFNRLPQAITHQKNTPYFEVLSVVPHAPSRWRLIQEEVRGVRRAEDDFVYQTVVVGNAQDALTGILLNPDIGAVVLSEGFASQGGDKNPLLEVFNSIIDFEASSKDAELQVLPAAQDIRKLRPELHLYRFIAINTESLCGHP